MKKIFIGIAFIVFCINASAQESWNLRSCIDYARQRNLQVQKSKITTDTYSVDVLQSKAALFPSLSGNISQKYANSQIADSNGDYKYEGTFAGQYALNASVTLFDGKRNLNSIKQAELQKSASEFSTQEIQNDIEISITQTYLQLLYARESIKNNENIVASSEAQLNQTKIFLDAGNITRSEYAQVEAQYSSDK